MILRVPGMLDPHVHLRDLDWSHKGTFASETAAALAGGYWAVLDMPNTPPPTITRVALDLKRASIARQAVCDWGLYFGAAPRGNQSEYAGIAADVCGLKIYNNATTGTLLIEDQAERERHYRAWISGKPIAVHAEGETVAEILQLVRQFRKPTHFCHISTRYEIDLLRAAKEEGLPISIGVTPHHLYLTDADLPALGALGLMKPTLKTAADRDALWEAIAEGVVDVVESDHAPHTLAEKQSANPPYGVPGLETTLPLLCLAVEQGRLTDDRLIELVAINPQRIFGLHPNPETYTLVDTDVHYVINRANLHTHCGWSPFEGMRVPGRVVGVWIRGVQVYDGENVLVEPGFGRDVAKVTV
jgi:carbamoyl-phosphate synthase/aspartate carbamoyltransferase/dihydroorotase